MIYFQAMPEAIIVDDDEEYVDWENTELAKKIQMNKTKTPAPKKGTLEYLFKDYNGESFKTTLINPVKPTGKEKW